MKTLRMFLIALCGVAMLIGTSSCKKEKQENENEGEMMRIEVSVGGTDGNTKTHLVHDGNKYKVAWDTWDSFELFPIDKTNGSSFRFSELTEGSDGTTAIFEGHRPGAAPFYGCYPSGKVSCEDAGVYEFTIDETQAGNPETVDEQTATANAGPMVGYMKDAESGLVFQNTMSWLKVGLKGEVVIKRVTLTDNGGNKLNGTLTVSNLSVGTDGKLSFETEMTGGTSKLEIVSNEGVQLNDEFTYFWFQVPAGSLASLNLSAYSDVEGTEKVLDLERTIALPGSAQGIPENTILTANVNESICPPIELTGLFSVSETKKVYFSKGNLQFNTTSKTWRVAENQWDVCNKVPYHTTTDYAEYSGKWIDLFGWGCTGNVPTDDELYVNYQPWSTTSQERGYPNNWFGYGPSYEEGGQMKNLSVSDGSDWGANMTGGWRTLTGGADGEWHYLLKERKVNGSTGYGNTCVWTTIEGVNGFIIFHDDYTGSTTGLTSIPEGCVFLPLGGRRVDHEMTGDADYIEYYGLVGTYWSSSHTTSSTASDAWALSIEKNNFDDKSALNRYFGLSVRLVKDAN